MNYWEQQKLERIAFFSVLGIEDDGRTSAHMTDEEFDEFSKKHRTSNGAPPKGEPLVFIHLKWLPYHDVTYTYCPTDKTIYESCYYIGE